LEQVGASFDAVRQRTQRLEGSELSASDILRPESWCLALVDAWQQAGLKREAFALVLDLLQRELAALALTQYQAVVKFYDSQGVASVTEDLRTRVRRPATVSGGSGHGPLSGPDGPPTGHPAHST